MARSYASYVTFDMQIIYLFTVIFILVVSSAVLLHDVSARGVDVSMGSPSFLLAEFCCFHLKNRVTVRLHQRSTKVQSMREKMITPSSMGNYVSTHKHQNTLQVITIKKIAVPFD